MSWCRCLWNNYSFRIYKQSQGQCYVGQYVAIAVHDKEVRCQCTFRVLQHIVMCLTRFPVPADQHRNTWFILLCLTAAIILLFTALFGARGGGRRVRSEESRVKDGWGKDVGVFAFVSHHSNLVLIGDKLNLFSPIWIYLVHDDKHELHEVENVYLWPLPDMQVEMVNCEHKGQPSGLLV